MCAATRLMGYGKILDGEAFAGRAK